MFTGIITAIGTITRIEELPDLRRLTIASAYTPESIDLGASIACNGVCLTVTGKGTDTQSHWFTVDMAAETLAVTTARHWQQGGRLNLERALRFGDELGGHLVSGHVDGVGEIAALTQVGDALRVNISLPPALMPFMAQKGSATINGVSLTVNETSATGISLLLIPHTLAETTLSDLQTGEAVNVEVDLFARYIDRLLSARGYGANA